MDFSVWVNNTNPNIGALYFNIPHREEIGRAYKAVSDRCYTALSEKYGANRNAQKRLETELRNIKNNGSSFFYRILMEIAALSKEENALMFCSPAGSFVDHLIGASPLDPLKPHYRCPSCLLHEEASLGKDGFDLPPEQGTLCGSDMERDGHDCSEWMIRSAHDRLTGRYGFGVRIAAPVLQRLQKHLDNCLSKTGSQPPCMHHNAYYKIELLHAKALDSIRARSGGDVPIAAVPTDDKQIWQRVASELRKRLQQHESLRVAPKGKGRAAAADDAVFLNCAELTFYDLLRLCGLVYGTFDTQPDLNEFRSDRFLLRDEVFDALREKGIPTPLAAGITNRAVWGNPELLPKELTYRLIPCRNLYRKADCINAVLTEYYLKWFQARGNSHG